MAAVFLNGRDVWQEITKRVRNGKRVHAAVAYFGAGAARILPLRKTDVLVVDMSLQAVAQGVTDPREVAKLVRRRVKVYSRSSLHAKFLTIDNILIVGSANASHNAVALLDEAAVLTADRTAVRSAKTYLEGLCTEPVRPQYLKTCIAAYRRPRFKAAVERRNLATQAKRPIPKLWIIGGLRYAEVPERERPRAEAAITRAKRLRRRPTKTYVDQVHYPQRFAFMRRMRKGDWALNCIRDGADVDVWPPEQLLSIESYPRGNGRRRWTMQFEAAKRAQSMRLTQFRRKTHDVLPWGEGVRVPTRAVYDAAVADAILRLWTDSGRLSSRRSQRRAG